MAAIDAELHQLDHDLPLRRQDRLRFDELVAKVGDRLTILSGDDGTAFPLYACGARGVISVVSNVAPRAMSDMWDAVKAGDWARAKQRHFELRVLNQMLFVEPSPAPAKYWLARSGLIDSAEVRLPMVEVSAELAALLDEEIERRGPRLLRRA